MCVCVCVSLAQTRKLFTSMYKNASQFEKCHLACLHYVLSTLFTAQLRRSHILFYRKCIVNLYITINTFETPFSCYKNRQRFLNVFHSSHHTINVSLFIFLFLLPWFKFLLFVFLFSVLCFVFCVVEKN